MTPEQEIKKLEEEIKEVDDILLDVLWQSCGDEDDEGDIDIDNRCMSAYERACDYLAKKGLLKKKNERFYMQIKANKETKNDN